MESKTYGYQFKNGSIDCSKNEKGGGCKSRNQSLNELQTDMGSFMIQRNPLNQV